jgi:ubiquitin-activating enzyme E1
MNGNKIIYKMDEEIDTNLYYRQICTIGMETMEKIIHLKVLIVEQLGLGIETAKNIILSGPEKVLLFDSKIVKLEDEGSNYFMNSQNIGVNRRDIQILEELKKLNPSISVKSLENYNNIEQIIQNILSLDVNIIVITEILSLESLTKINNICRNNKIKFIYGLVIGLCSFIFTDFGKEHSFFNNLKND